MFDKFKKLLNCDRDSESYDSINDMRRVYSRTKTFDGNAFSLKNDRAGFAITFEIMLTVLLVVTFMTNTVFFTTLYETQRYFADVTSSTCTMVARYGGNDSAAYKVQVANGGDIMQNAQAQLNQINGSSKFEPHIYVSKQVGTTAKSGGSCKEGYVQVILEYKLNQNSLGPWSFLSSYGLLGRECVQTFEIPSLVQKGKLIA